MLAAMNPDGRSNADVVPRWVNGQDVTGQPRNMWIVDFGVGTSEAEAALYEGQFEWFDVEATDPRIRSTPPAMDPLNRGPGPLRVSGLTLLSALQGRRPRDRYPAMRETFVGSSTAIAAMPTALATTRTGMAALAAGSG